MGHDYIQEYLLAHSIYGKIRFSSSSCNIDSMLPPVLQASQAIIDKCISTDKRRIVIILPDDHVNISPLIISKYFANLQERPEYSHGIWDAIEAGQHLKIGKAVVEFDHIDNDSGNIVLVVGKPTKFCSQGKLTTPMKDYFAYFEKSNAALTSTELFNREKKRIKEQLAETGMIDIEILKTKRSFLNKTFFVLAQKNDYFEYLSDLKVSGSEFSDVVAYGEINLTTDTGYSVSNKGQLDCLPALLVSPRLSDCASAIEDERFDGRVESVIVYQSKFQELINNTDELKKCLRSNIPMIVFASESDFDSFPILEEMGFEFWSWTNELLCENHLSDEELIQPDDSLFSTFSKKVFYSSHCHNCSQICKDLTLKSGIATIRRVLKSSEDMSASLRTKMFDLYSIGKFLMDIMIPINMQIRNDVFERVEKIIEEWNIEKGYYVNSPIALDIENGISFIRTTIDNVKLTKTTMLDELVKDSDDKIIAIVVPNRFRYKDELVARTIQSWRAKKVYVYSAVEFINNCQNMERIFDNVIVTFFDDADYIAIKKSYCYKKITYLLYDFENQWRKRHINRINECIPEDKIRKKAVTLGILSQNKKNIYETFENEDDFPSESELVEYNYEQFLMRDMISKSGSTVSQINSVECVPIIFDQTIVGYFWPHHSLIDITDLCAGNADSSRSKEACKMKKGNIVLFRKSEKDIVREKADELLIKANATGLREISETWVRALRHIAENKTENKVCELINKDGYLCDGLQVRYWLAGDTICPDKIEVLQSISLLASSIMPMDKVNEVYNAGKAIQEFHRKAGRWLTAELKQKSREIRDMYRSGYNEGFLDGIGDVEIHVVNDVLEKEFVDRSKMNRIEEVL